MKVLFVWRGPSPYRVDFFNELGKLCDLTVLFERSPNLIKDKDINWFHENYDYFKGIYLKGCNIVGKLWFCYEIFSYLKRHRDYDIIVLGTYSTFTQMISIIYMRMKGIKYVLNSDGGFVKKDRYFIKKIKRFFIQGASAYICSSKKTAEYLSYYGAVAPMYIYPFTSAKANDVNKHNDELTKMSNRKLLGIKEQVVFLYTGQFIHRKGIDILLKASFDLPDNCGVYIVGGKPTKDFELLTQSVDAKKIHFIDFVEPDKLHFYYEAADVYVFPTREDIWGLVINEAMAYGLPIITTEKCLAGKELVINGENGYIVGVEDNVSLREMMLVLSKDENLRKEISHNNKRKIKAFTVENMAQVHFDTFKQIVMQ